MKTQNNLKEYREMLLLSKTKLSKKAKISFLTITRIEKGFPCRADTQRKIIKALGLGIDEKSKVFPEQEKQGR